MLEIGEQIVEASGRCRSTGMLINVTCMLMVNLQVE